MSSIGTDFTTSYLNSLTSQATNLQNSQQASDVEKAASGISKNSSKEELTNAAKTFESYFVEQVMKEIKKSTDDLNGDDDSDTYAKQVSDMNMDYMHQMDEAHPLEALAEKMIRNMFNGPYERRATHVAKLVRHFQPDGVISFCHWGCRQSSGGVNILREEMRRIGMPLLVLDGDAIDRRNSHDGQIKTRLEAFLEMIK